VGAEIMKIGPHIAMLGGGLPTGAARRCEGEHYCVKSAARLRDSFSKSKDSASKDSNFLTL
jgi:hypothetical protein